MLNPLWVIAVLEVAMKETNMNVSSVCHFVETKDEKYLSDCYPSSVNVELLSASLYRKLW